MGNKKKYKKAVAHFAAVTGNDPLKIKQAYKGRKSLLREHWDSKDAYAGIGAFSIVIPTIVGTLSLLLAGAVPVAAGAAVIGTLGVWGSCRGIKKINKQVNNEVQKFLEAPEPRPKLPAPQKPPASNPGNRMT